MFLGGHGVVCAVVMLPVLLLIKTMMDLRGLFLCRHFDENTSPTGMVVALPNLAVQER